jgi:hypothetical protein
VFATVKRTILKLLAVYCIVLVIDGTSAQGQMAPQQQPKPEPESPEVKRLKTVERHFGTVGAGVFLMLLGLAGVGKAVWMIRPVFRGASVWHKVGIVALILAGILIVSAGVDLAQHGARGESLDQWLLGQ